MKTKHHEPGQEGLVAVIVGIDGYKDKDAGPLHCAVNDAVSLAETFKKVWQGRRVLIKTLTWAHQDENKGKVKRETGGVESVAGAAAVTRKGILAEVQGCAELAEPGDTFVFYFSGHGVLADEEPTLVTIADGKTAAGIDYIKIREIQQAAAGCASNKRVMILDCCQNLKGKDELPEGYGTLSDLARGWSIFLSCSPGEFSLEDQYFGDSRDDYLQQGIFTASLVEGLRGEAAGSSGSVSLADLVYFVGRRVPVEYQERLAAILSVRGKPKTGRRRVLFSQNPVLLCESIAMAGPLQIVMAPLLVPTCHRARLKLPGKHFIGNWFKFLGGKWPIKFPLRFAFWYVGAFLYAAVMMLTVILHWPGGMGDRALLFFIAVGLGSALLWWALLPFAVAVNEARWHSGGYITSILFLLWHCGGVLWFARMYGTAQNMGLPREGIIYLAMEFFLILAGVVICGCNASQTIISLAETIRTDERREIRQAIRVFQQFKYRILGVDLYNYVATVVARPVLYLFILSIAIVMVVINSYQVMAAYGTAASERINPVVFFLRNGLVLLFMAWLTFWYDAAFKYIQKEVYTR